MQSLKRQNKSFFFFAVGNFWKTHAEKCSYATNTQNSEVHHYSRTLLAPAFISALLASSAPHPNQDVTAAGYAHRIPDA